MLTTNQRFAFFYFMERYIFIRDYGRSCFDAFRMDMLLKDGESIQVSRFGEGRTFPWDMTEIDEDLAIHLLPIDADLFKTAFQSFAYANWMKEKAADIDDHGNPLYPTLTRTPETLIMYLMELGISSDTLMRYMYGTENKYLEYKYLVQEFGKML